jgi:small subunit ribosomal protein S6
MYELVYIVRPTVDEQTLAALKEKIENFIAHGNGTISQRDDWGKRSLAYPISKFTEGYYTVLQFEMPSTAVRDLERSLGLTEEVLRYLVVKQEVVAAPAATTTPAA